jgi:hypothetical protein
MPLCPSKYTERRFPPTSPCPAPPESENRSMAGREKELLERIRQLEEQNSALQDKLDMIWAVLAPDYEEGEDPDSVGNLVQIDTPAKKPG